MKSTSGCGACRSSRQTGVFAVLSIASHRIASHRIISHPIASHPSHRISHRIISHPIASHGTGSHEPVFITFTPGPSHCNQSIKSIPSHSNIEFNSIHMIFNAIASPLHPPTGAKAHAADLPVPLSGLVNRISRGLTRPDKENGTPARAAPRASVDRR